MFLDLIGRGYTAEARHFFDAHKAEYNDQYASDMMQLAGIKEPHHVKENALATLFRQNKYTIAMSSYAFELLVSYLQDSKFMTLLKYLNQFLNIKSAFRDKIRLSLSFSSLCDKTIAIIGKRSSTYYGIDGSYKPRDSLSE